MSLVVTLVGAVGRREGQPRRRVAPREDAAEGPGMHFFEILNLQNLRDVANVWRARSRLCRSRCFASKN